MQKINTLISKDNKNIKLKSYYGKALSNKNFKDFVDTIDLKDEVLMKYTSEIEDSLIEIENCKTCLGLKECPNLIKGHVLTPTKQDKGLVFSYLPCSKYQKDQENFAYLKNVTCFNLPKELSKASFKNAYRDDNKRLPIFKYFKDFIDNYQHKKDLKGLYLSGSFGSGKTYLIAAFFNEMAKKGVNSCMVYYPELLRSLKSSFGSNYEDKYDFIKSVPLLLLDDIGAENTTSWSRDEVLGPILQYRMEEDLPTFFTSNLNIDELETTLSITGSGIDKIKAKRIIERIKYLTTPLELISKNRR